MKLRPKTLLITGIIIGVLLLGIYTVVYGLVENGVAELEARNLKDLVHDVAWRVDDEGAHVYQALGDWASWDDTYNFMETRSEAYVESNLEDVSLAAAETDIMGFYDAEGRTVLIKMVKGGDSPRRPIPKELASLKPDDALLAHGEVGGAIGFLLLGGRLTAVASRPILTSKGAGPMRGTIMMGRYITDEMIAMSSGTTSLNTSMWILDTPMPDDARSAVGELEASGNESVVKNLDDHVQAGYFFVQDIYGNPRAILRVKTLRSGHAEFVKGMQYMAIAFVIVAGLFEVLNFVLLDMFVLSRLRRLGEQTSEIGGGGNEKEGVPVDKEDDEISGLTSDINTMLSRLHSVRRELLRNQISYNHRLRDEVRQKTRLLAAVNARLRRMEKTKNQFLFNIGHELKSPLAVIEMNLATIMGGKATAKQVKEGGRMINRNLLRLKQKIEEIIQLSRFEHDRQVQKDDLDFSELVREVAETYRDFASVKKAKLHVEGADRRRLVMGDRHLLQYALGNLFSNAVKYCDRRDIYVKVAQDGKNVVFSIANSGVGIKPENRHKLFDRFFKEDQNSPGTGVGLFITREIARSHSGNVWYEPGKPRGAVFYFSIPVAERRDMYGKK